MGGRQARQSAGRGELLDAPDAEGTEGSLRRSTPAILRRLELLQEQAGGEGPSALHFPERIHRPAGAGVIRLRPAVVQKHVRPRHLEDGRAASRNRLWLSTAR